MTIRTNGQIIAGSGGGIASVDDLSITVNSSNELQTVGVIDSNNTTNAIKTWTGTKAQYNAIASKDPNTLYNITDDTDVSLTILEALYPVGSVYITTANTCPLSALINGSTWELVSSGRVLQGADSGHSAGTTIEAGLPNITGGIVARPLSSSMTSYAWWEAKNTGAFIPEAIQLDTDGASHAALNSSGVGNYKVGQVNFDASRSSSIYGNSTTVQPPAYIVNIFKRTV